MREEERERESERERERETWRLAYKSKREPSEQISVCNEFVTHILRLSRHF